MSGGFATLRQISHEFHSSCADAIYSSYQLEPESDMARIEMRASVERVVMGKCRYNGDFETPDQESCLCCTVYAQVSFLEKALQPKHS